METQARKLSPAKLPWHAEQARTVAQIPQGRFSQCAECRKAPMT